MSLWPRDARCISHTGLGNRWGMPPSLLHVGEKAPSSGLGHLREPCETRGFFGVVARDSGLVWAGFFLFVVAYEEPALGEQFADEYKRYRANVRRWLPRITPWRG